MNQKIGNIEIPCDVKVGGATLKAGVSFGTLLRCIERHNQYFAESRAEIFRLTAELYAEKRRADAAVADLGKFMCQTCFHGRYGRGGVCMTCRVTSDSKRTAYEWDNPFPEEEPVASGCPFDEPGGKEAQGGPVSHGG